MTVLQNRPVQLRHVDARREPRQEPRIHALGSLPPVIETRQAAAVKLWVVLVVGDGRLVIESPVKQSMRLILEKGSLIAFRAQDEIRAEFLAPGYCAVGYLDRDPMSDLWQARAPHPAAPGRPVMIDEALILKIVVTFYARICGDPLLAPQFLDVIADWPIHLRRLCNFWSSVTLLTGAYKGDVLDAHRNLRDMTPAHFERWLALFEEVVGGYCIPEQANIFNARALRIAGRIAASAERQPT